MTYKICGRGFKPNESSLEGDRSGMGNPALTGGALTVILPRRVGEYRLCGHSGPLAARNVEAHFLNGYLER